MGTPAKKRGRNTSSTPGLPVRKPDWRKKFLEALARMPSPAAAAAYAGIDRCYAYRARERYPKFRKAWDQAIAVAVDNAEGRLYALGVHGVQRNVVMKFKERGREVARTVDTYTEYSERCLIEFLRANKRDVYGVQRTELSGPNGAPIAPVVAPTQVIIQIPDNGRGESGAAPAITVNTKPVPPSLPPAQDAQALPAPSESERKG